MLKDNDAILSDGEGYTFEFKENPDKALAQEVCTFANASGGMVLIVYNRLEYLLTGSL